MDEDNPQIIFSNGSSIVYSITLNDFDCECINSEI